MILNVDGEEGQSIPLIVDSPHSGVIYPSDFNHQAEFSKLRQAEDSYVDELYNFIKRRNINKVDLIFTDLNSENTKVDLKKVTDKPTCVIIGPEGDFSEEERAKILKFSRVQPLKINENILRSETAVISAISIIKYAIN